MPSQSKKQQTFDPDFDGSSSDSSSDCEKPVVNKKNAQQFSILPKRDSERKELRELKTEIIDVEKILFRMERDQSKIG